jgi:hypothetical protein
MQHTTYNITWYKKGKQSLYLSFTGPENFRGLRLPDFETDGT